MDGSSHALLGSQVVVGAVWGLVAAGHTHWAWTRRVELRSLPLGLLPGAIALVAWAMVVSSIWYGATQAAPGLDLAQHVTARGFVQGAIAFSASWLLVPYWRAHGVSPDDSIRRWVLLMAGAAAVWWATWVIA